MSLEQLPTELKTIIFSHFTTRELRAIIEPVSPRWKILAIQPTLWQRVEFRKAHYSLEEVIERLNRSFLARSVHFFEFEPILNFPQPLLANNNVRELKFTSCYFSNYEISQLVDNFPNISTFHLIASGLNVRLFNDYSYNYYPYSHGVNLDIVSKITDWKLLKSIELINCVSPLNDDEDDIIIKIAEKCEFLETMRINRLDRVTMTSLFELIKLRRHQLKVLGMNLASCESGLADELQGCSKLTVLSLYDVYDAVDDEQFVQLSKLPYLKKLEIFAHGLFYDDSFHHYTNFCFHQLEVLNFESECSITRAIIDTGFPRLKKINNYDVDQYLKLNPRTVSQ